MSTCEDRFNLQVVDSQARVDGLNKSFYGRFNFPWPPVSFEAVTDPGFGLKLLHQDIGCWRENRLPPRPRIWVAGCGTNQAVYTALRFPTAKILGTDLSRQSLATCERSAAQLGITNLSLAEESINEAKYHEEFDYVICTGVIHHNADPSLPLHRLATALTKDGVMELMVYNYYHRILSTAFQKAIRDLCGDGSTLNLDVEMSLACKLVYGFPVDNLMGRFLAQARGIEQADLADRLLQPVEHSYTVASFEKLISGCDLEFLLPTVNQFDKAAGNLTWNVEFEDAEIADLYDPLPDSRRWQITNLLLANDSPMQWFFLQRKDSGHERSGEKEVCGDFLELTFGKVKGEKKIYRRRGDGGYVMAPRTVPFPSPSLPADPLAREVFTAVEPGIPIKFAFRKRKIDTSFHNVNRARIYLTTSLFPYLQVGS